MTLTPAYGRDYKSKKAALADWEAGKDFTIADVFSGDHGRKINREDAVNSGVREVNIRYQQLTKIAVVTVR